MERVTGGNKIGTNNGSKSRGLGVFARKLMERYHYCPMEEEAACMTWCCGRTFTRVYAYHDWHLLK